MKAEFKLFAIGLVFYVLATVAYIWLTIVLADQAGGAGQGGPESLGTTSSGPELVGTTALAFTCGLALLLAFYLYLTGRRSGERPEDRLYAEIEEGAGELGFFSPHSVWPVYLGASTAVVTLGLVFAPWLIFVGVVATGLSVLGLVFEYYRGEHAH